MPEQKKLVRVFIILCAGVLMTLGVLKGYNDAQDKNLIFQFNKDRKQLAEHVVELESSATNKMVDDYSIWNDLYLFSKKPDSTWAKDNLDNVLTGYDLHSLFVLNESGKLEHVAVAPGEKAQKFQFLDSKGGLPTGTTPKTFYEWQNGDLYQIRVKHFLDDVTKKPLPGYFAIADKINAGHLANISKLAVGKAEISNDPFQYDSRVSSEPVFKMELPLPGIEGSPVAWLSIQSESPVLKRMQNRSNESILHFAIGLFSLAIVMTFLMRRIVVVNRVTLDNAIKTGRADKLVDSSKANDLLGDVAKAIESRTDQEKIVELNLSLEGQVNQRNRELEIVASASLMSFIEMLETRPDVLTSEQQEVVKICDEFACHLSLPIQSVINLRQGIYLHSYVTNDGLADLPWLQSSIFEESPTLEPILAIYRNADKPWQVFGQTIDFETRIFAVVRAWVQACSEQSDSDASYRKAADTLNSLAPETLDPNLVPEFLTFFKARVERVEKNEVA